MTSGFDNHDPVLSSPRPQQRLHMTCLLEPPSPPKAVKSCDRVNKLILENLESLCPPFTAGSENVSAAMAAPPSLQLQVQGNTQATALFEKALQRMREGPPERAPFAPLLTSDKGEAPRRRAPTLPTPSSVKEQETPRTPIRGPPQRKHSGLALSA